MHSRAVVAMNQIPNTRLKRDAMPSYFLRLPHSPSESVHTFINHLKKLRGTNPSPREILTQGTIFLFDNIHSAYTKHKVNKNTVKHFDLHSYLYCLPPTINNLYETLGQLINIHMPSITHTHTYKHTQ